jgi:hypothetical protein
MDEQHEFIKEEEYECMTRHVQPIEEHLLHQGHCIQLDDLKLKSQSKQNSRAKNKKACFLVLFFIINLIAFSALTFYLLFQLLNQEITNIYDYATTKLISISNPNTTTTTRTNTTAHRCPFSDKLYRDPTNCAKFYPCLHVGTVYETIVYFDCPTGTHFSHDNERCDYYNKRIC